MREKIAVTVPAATEFATAIQDGLALLAQSKWLILVRMLTVLTEENAATVNVSATPATQAPDARPEPAPLQP